MKFKIYPQPSSQAKVADKEKKRGTEKHKNFKFLENEKCFLDKIKNIFHYFLRVII